MLFHLQDNAEETPARIPTFSSLKWTGSCKSIAFAIVQGPRVNNQFYWILVIAGKTKFYKEYIPGIVVTKLWAIMEGRLIAALASEDVECFSNFLGYFECI